MKAIETVYKGYRFRSRLEARWAVFFDTMGFSWQYEPECMKFIAPGMTRFETWYLPDFTVNVNETKVWLEIKRGYTDLLPAPDETSRIMKYCWFDIWIRDQVNAGVRTDEIALMISGSPWPDQYEVLRTTGENAKSQLSLDSQSAAWTQCPQCSRIGLTSYHKPSASMKCKGCQAVVKAADDSVFLQSPKLMKAYTEAKTATF